ncbi:TPA: flagellar hook-length control protein FliK [Campylobacter lari]|uniref:Flagellar hook-length control protein FliK n=3 Tax=Campylobacter lari TaxID=201 RepID=A0A825SJK0_CAMLA|nr:flagellar hook-length control protein FliK [Campylobacter lari]EAH6293166.1 flagellar hook-length control protein FliK [Campylobacter lari]EAH8152319.1 flagellar hook-length control protein FliK [Campylobacter lari]EAI3913047.1 flagellar hook-length control protein FliK [Campylobacter lari]EAI4483362.1 flagellar hook-length control protein FliK [Campylobacter lari]EAI6155486.1 flagellar hook-length control protein FliK [Campylobacter lari]
MSNIQASDALNLLSIAPQNENPSKESNNSNGDGEEFLNSLLQAIDEKDGSLSKDFKAPQKENKNESLKETINDKAQLDEKDALKLFEGANFMQILSLLEVLQSDSKDIKLNKLVQDNTAILALEKNLHKLKNIKNINELFNIAKELGLNIKNIKFEQIKDLKEAFPNLDKKGFFKAPNLNNKDLIEPQKQNNTNVFQDLINQKITKLLKEEPNSSKNIKSKENEGVSLLSSALKNIELPKKDIKAKENIQNVDFKEKFIEKIQDNKEIKDTKNIKNISKNDKLNDIELINLTQNLNLKKEIKDKEKIDFKEVLKNEKLTTSEDSFGKKISSVLENSKELKAELTNTKNTQNLQNQNQDLKINLENLLNPQEKQLKTEKNTQNTDIFSDIFKNTKELTKDDSDHNEENLNSYVKEMNRVSNNFMKNQNIPMKETFNDFAQEFKDKLESYKAPITRFSITLNPHNLGEVEVTLVQRGSNLNISFNSNQNTLNLFIQHQAEFKNALVNMGFTNLEMNFSDQGRKEQNQQQKHKQNNNSKEDKVNFEREIQEKPSLEMVLAKYF